MLRAGWPAGHHPRRIALLLLLPPWQPLSGSWSMLWAEEGPLISTRLQRVTGAALDDGSLVTARSAEENASGIARR